MKHRLLIWGARKKSIGHATAGMWRDLSDFKVTTAGVSGEEDITLEGLESAELVSQVYEEVRPTRVLVTVGMNRPRGEDDFEYWFQDHMRVNAYLPMHLLMTWFEQEGEAYPPEGAHFVAMSSNSARIPRSQSMAYNASKAALSMAIQSAARDVGKASIPMSVYCYEPGLIKGTPMTAERGGTRMLGLPEGISRRTLANHIVNGLLWGGPEMNGLTLRLDAGEV